MPPADARSRPAGRVPTALAVGLAAVPKCGLCVLGWLLTLEGTATCTGNPSWHFLLGLFRQRFGSGSLAVAGGGLLVLLGLGWGARWRRKPYRP